ncbi:MAG: bifunctional phosphoribosylaminoimidazolecarboxamide formyltransferase/IMP cyclohydrolase [Acidobacteriota bacterium]|nr:bifunctional phosphoribosylaminoimidazolecarboxamide formyltransferase/IMP cyclohydrolase [Acidobacteriota bacterium]
MAKIRRALLSVTDKTGIAGFAQGLARLQIELISTGGTAKLLRESGLAVRDASELTGFPEMLDGRVKTMHPHITGAILAMRSNPEHMAALARHSIEPIDMVVVNLYDFAKIAADPDARLEDLIENIDIGGPTMIRSAAKNYQDVAVIISPSDYAPILQELQSGGDLSRNTLWNLAVKAFETTAAYDRAISRRLADVNSAVLPPVLDLQVPKRFDLRYGENPHQSAALYSSATGGIAGAEQLHGKELSYNNLVDLDAAWQLIREFTSPATAIIKHTNPCGCAEQTTLAESYRLALECDPVSAFGSVIGFNRPVDAATATLASQLFVEAIAAPDYEPGALAILRAKKNIRLLRVTSHPDAFVVRSIEGGFLAQTSDTHQLAPRSAAVKTRRAPTPEEWNALDFAWKVAKHVKSNAIVYARPGQIVAVGAGQMSRVDSVKVGASRARLPLTGSVIGSDAFFPFPDGLEEAAMNGITAAIQPGGSVKDAEVIAAADRLNLAMVFTGIRHFRH